jgi:iron complex outermembrane recepter protein
MRLSVAVTLCVLSSMCLAADPAKASIRKITNIPAEGLGAALQALASTYDFQVLYRTEVVKDLKTHGAVGTFTPQEALGTVLAGTGLAYKYVDDRTVTIIPALTITTTQSSSPQDPSEKEAGKNSSQEFLVAQVDQGQNPGPSSVTTESGEGREKKSEPLEEVVVTGTNIHDVKPTSPTTVITGQEMINQGYSRLEQVFDQLSQNFNGGASQTSNPTLGVGRDASNNQFLASGVNLRGLGPGATLVLLNGSRLATSALGTSVDISSIPLAAIDRVEILTDGASAIYGSDAVAGVVNIITKQSYSGVEAGVRSTGISEGKTADYGGHILGGYDWGSGHFMASFDGEKDNELLASARAFEPPTTPYPLDLIPEQIRRNFYGAIQQNVSDRLSLTSDVLTSDRTFNNRVYSPDYGPTNGYASMLATSLRADLRISTDWRLKLSGQFSREKDAYDSYAPYLAPDFAVSFYTYKTSSVDTIVDGRLFDLPAGSVKAAFGGQAKRESLDYETVLASQEGSPAPPGTAGQRTSQAAYSELFIPIISEKNSVFLVRDLTLDVAGRYDHYSDFGSTTNPKVALRWVPLEGLSFHSSFAKSFKAPLLYQLGNGGGLSPAGVILPAPDPSSASGTRTTLVLDGPNPDLQPERANSVSTGMSFTPSLAPGLSIELSYFHIDYKDRVDRLIEDGFYSNVITDASELGPLVNLNPTVSQVTQALNSPPGIIVYNGLNNYCVVGTTGCAVDPASIKAIANIGYENVGVAVAQGYDLASHYERDSSLGRLFLAVDGTLMTDNSIQITPTSAITNLLNTFGEPLRFRAKANAGIQKSHWTVYGRINFSNAYHNPDDPSCPGPLGCKIASWTTFDTGVSYSTLNEDGGNKSGLRIAVDVMNLFNRNPPFANDLNTEIPLAYDPLNANPMLRTLALSVTKAW